MSLPPSTRGYETETFLPMALKKLLLGVYFLNQEKNHMRLEKKFWNIHGGFRKKLKIILIPSTKRTFVNMLMTFPVA